MEQIQQELNREYLRELEEFLKDLNTLNVKHGNATFVWGEN